MATAQLVAAGRPIRLRYALGWYAGRGLRIVLCALAVLSVVATISILALVTSNYRPMVVSTSSMDPTFGVGDVIVSQVVPPSAVAVGDVVTYSDSFRGGALITERVVQVHQDGSTFAFTTKGDASSVEERWSIDRESSVGRVAYRIPGLGGTLAAISLPAARATVLIGLLSLLVGPVARRVRASSKVA